MAEYLDGKSGPWKSAFSWLTAFPITQRWGENGETGIDLGTPYHTEITSLCAGQVLGAGYYDGGGVVSIAYTWKGNPVALYYQHFDTIEDGIVPGAAVKAGQKLGLSGGQLQGGSHPSLPRYSTGPHMEVGVNAPYGSLWNPHHYRPNFAPGDVLTTLAKGGEGVGTWLSDAASAAQDVFGIGKLLQGVFDGWVVTWLTQGNTGATAVQISTQPGFIPVAQAIHDAETFRPIDVTNLLGSFIHNGGVLIFRLTIAAAALLILSALVFRISQRAYNGAAAGANQTLQAASGAVQAAGLLAGI